MRDHVDGNNLAYQCENRSPCKNRMSCWNKVSLGARSKVIIIFWIDPWIPSNVIHTYPIMQQHNSDTAGVHSYDYYLAEHAPGFAHNLNAIDTDQKKS